MHSGLSQAKDSINKLNKEQLSSTELLNVLLITHLYANLGAKAFQEIDEILGSISND